MKHKTRIKALSWLLSLALALSLVPGMGLTTYAATLDSSSTTWSEDSTIESDVTISNAVTVSADITLTIPEGKTLTVNGGINANGHTLTVSGSGTLTVTGTNGANENDSAPPLNGDAGGIGAAGITGSLVVNGATVQVTGGNGGNGGNGNMYGGNGGNGGSGVDGNITVNSGSATVTGGSGGSGGTGRTRDDGVAGSVGRAVTGTITGTIISGSATGQTVTVEAATTVDVTGVTLAPETAQSINVGGSVAFTATVAPDGATDKTVKWSTTGGVTLYSDENCTSPITTGTAISTLTVYAKGTAAGSATVTVTTNNGNKSASSNVTVNAATHNVTITAGSNMTKTEGSGAASQTGLSGAMTDVVYTADDGYYFPENYVASCTVTANSGVSVTRDSYTQITVSGTPTGNAEITLTAPTAKTTPGAPTTVTATDCTTAANNDGKLTGITTAMEYKKSDATEWTAGTGSDITGLVSGTYYVRVKATDTTNASGNQELTVKGFISYTVTFKVVNGKWNEGEGDAATADKAVTLTGHDGDTLKLTADQIPAVGSKPNDTYKAGSWDVTPSADTAITEATTYTYTYAQKDAAVVTKAPEAKTLTYNGQAQALVTAGEATGGEMQYALGTNATTAPDASAYTTDILTKTDAGTYYVWYKVVGDENHSNSAAACVTATISRPSSDDDSSTSTSTTTTTTKDNTSNPDASTTNGTATVSTTKNADGSTTAKTTETATVAGENGSKTEVKAESSTTTKSNTDGSTTATTTATQTATTTAADGTKTVTETKTEAKETLDKSGNGTVKAKTTETVKDASGKVTATTVTESKGTVSTATDGTKTTTTTNTAVTTAADGTKTTVVTTEKAVETTDGSTGKVVSDESGKVVAVEAKVSETAAESAAKSGEAVTLPVTVTAAQSAENATAVEITVPKDAESVKVEIPVEDVKPGTVAIIVHEDGTEEIVKTSTTSGNGVVLALESGASVKVVDNTKNFNDVSGSEWYADNVTWAASREVMNGVSRNTFAPNADTNRAMVTQILYNLDSGKADGAIPTFSDVSANDWYADSVTWAVSNGVARGEGSSFGANDAVTREQLAVMLYNYADMKGYRTTDRGDMSRFADNGRTSSWATDAMAWAVGVGILNGTKNADGSVSLNPQGNASRAQVTAMTERFCGKAAK